MVDITDELHRALKSEAYRRGITLKQLILEIIEYHQKRRVTMSNTDLSKRATEAKEKSTYK